MRGVAFLVVGLGLLLLQENVFRALDHVSAGGAAAAWLVALLADLAAMVRRARGPLGHPRRMATFRADFTLPATVLLAQGLLVSLGHGQWGPPIPALVLPLILFMGVHEYSLARGAAVAGALGYATDVLGGAPVGLYWFTYVAVFALARAAGVRLAAQTTWMQVLLVGAFTIAQSTIVLVLLAIFGPYPSVPRVLYPLILPHAVATAALAPIVFRLSETIHAATAATPRQALGGGPAR